MILALMVSIMFTPFNNSLCYPGDQAGKGAAPMQYGCLAAGNTALDASGNMQVIYAVYDEAGVFQWADSVFWGQSSEILSITGDSMGVLFNGSSCSPSTSEDGLVWSLSPELQPLWTFSLELPLQDRFTSSARGTGGMTVCAGSTNSLGAGGNDVLMVAVDGTGEQVWRKTYGTAGEEAVYHISPCSDGGFVLACQAMDWGAGNGDYWIIRTDMEGDTLWTATCGGPEFDYPWRVIQSDGFFYVAGNTLSFGEGSYDWWILKLDSSGNVVWQKSWGTENTDTCMALEKTPTGIIVGGASEPVLNMFQATLVSFDENGEVESEWYYQPGMIRSINAVNDGCFLVGGTAFSSDGDLWALCVDSSGYAPEMGVETSNTGPNRLLSVNPVSSSLSVTLPEGWHNLRIIDLTGRTVHEETAPGGMTLIDLLQHPAGIYTLVIGNGIEERFTILR